MGSSAAALAPWSGHAPPALCHQARRLPCPATCSSMSQPEARNSTASGWKEPVSRRITRSHAPCLMRPAPTPSLMPPSNCSPTDRPARNRPPSPLGDGDLQRELVDHLVAAAGHDEGVAEEDA